jgi:RNA polymerase sigma-70 factor (ECF subfamily)
MTRHDSNSDEALIEAIQRGDEDAAACLYYRHVDRVHRICCRIVLDSSQAPDCVQEVWMKVFRNLGRFQYERSFATWLNAVAANTAIDHYRRYRRRGNPANIDEICMESLATEQSAADPQCDDATIRREIQDALEETSVNQRTAFVLRYFEEMPLPEIAKTLGCRQGTVRTHIRRCLLALRARLADKLNQEVQEYGQ